MPACQKCQTKFPNKIVINGKHHNVQNRKYCLKCSPFGLHNTAKLHERWYCDNDQIRVCISCGKLQNPKQKKGSKKCWSCNTKELRKRKMDKLLSIVGEHCWICKYNKCRAALEFHHVDPTTKVMQLTSREMQFKWGKIWTEAQKCIILCACCHREYHYGLIPQSIIIGLHTKQWSEILNKLTIR